MSKILLIIKDYFTSVISETKKITWPSRQQVINQTIVVVVAVVILAVLFALIDFVFSDLVKILINWRR